MNGPYPHSLAIAFLASSLVITTGCSEEAGATSNDGPKPFVEVVEADEGTLPLEERVSGVVRAENQVAIRPEIEAPIVEVLVRNGDTVRSGQPLVRQDASALNQQVREAEASVRLARAAAEEEEAGVAEVEARVRRSRSLAEEKLISQQELETLEAQLAAARASAAQAMARVEQAEAALAERRRELERATIRAPITGTIGRRDAEVGMIAGPGDVVFVIGDLDALIIEVPLTEEMLRYVETGQTVRIHSPRLEGGSMEGTLARISPFLESGSFSTVGEIEIGNPDGRLQPGMFVQVDLLYGESERATLVPTSALWEDPETGELAAWVVRDPEAVAGSPGATGHVERRKISVVGEGRLSAAIDGVDPGEWVVIIGQHLFEGRDGDARLRSTTWERVAELQSLQREDLLDDYLAKQQRLARLLGSRPLSNEEFLGSATPIDPEHVVPADGGL